jgi:aminoglycoside phosphotransferase (APT) family kinase protein
MSNLDKQNELIPAVLVGSKRTPYLFVVGCPRSGTTLLQRMLNHHPLLAVANDSHFIPLAIADTAIGTDPNLTLQQVDWVRSYHRFHRLGLSEAAVDAAAEKSQTYGEFVSALYNEYSQVHGKQLAGEKTPDYVRHLPRLHALFPWVKSIHIIRDGRDVALSTLEWANEVKGPGKYRLWLEEPTAVCAMWWRWQVSCGRRDGAFLSSDAYTEIRYEDLVSDPQVVLQRLAVFLEIPFSEDMLNFYQGKRRYETGLSAKKAWLPPTPGLRDWRTQMTDRDIELFEALAGDLLSDLGYERRVTSFSREIIILANRYRKQWELESGQREAGRKSDLNSLQNQFSVRIQTVPPQLTARQLQRDKGLLPEDIELIQRDPGLPGLSVALSPPALSDLLHDLLPNADLGIIHNGYVRYKYRTSCLVAYALELAGTPMSLYVKAYQSEGQIKLAHIRNRSSRPGKFGSGHFVVDQLALAIFIFPNDNKLPALSLLSDSQTRQLLLHRLFPDNPGLWESRLQTLAYKPERRYVARLLSDSGEQVIARLYRYSDFNPVQQKTGLLRSSSRLRIARCLAHSDRHHLLVSEWLPGFLLSELISTGSPDLSTLANTGTALAELHAQPGERLPQRTPQTEARRLVEQAGGLGILSPDLAGKSLELAQKLGERLVQVPTEGMPIHGDFYPAQVLIDGGQVVFLDLDEAVRGHPAADIGSFLGRLLYQVIEGEFSYQYIDPLHEALLSGYRQVGHSPNPVVINLYTAVSLFHLAQDPFRYREPGWSARIHAILDHIEAILESIPVRVQSPMVKLDSSG